MAEGLLGKKVGMTQVYNEKGEIIPVTVLEVGPCFVTQIKSPDKDGYSAVQMGFGETRRLNKPERGHLKGVPSLKYLREVRDACTGWRSKCPGLYASGGATLGQVRSHRGLAARYGVCW